jgi:hypothetical protein
MEQVANGRTGAQAVVMQLHLALIMMCWDVVHVCNSVQQAVAFCWSLADQPLLLPGTTNHTS